MIPRHHLWPENYRRSMARKVSTVEQNMEGVGGGARLLTPLAGDIVS
jgi:hypothetical protein